MSKEQSVIDLAMEIATKELEVKQLRERLSNILSGGERAPSESTRTRCMDAKEQIVQLIAESPSKSFTRESVSKKVRISRAAAGAHLCALVEDGLLQKVARGVYRAAQGKTSNGART